MSARRGGFGLGLGLGTLLALVAGTVWSLRQPGLIDAAMAAVAPAPAAPAGAQVKLDPGIAAFYRENGHRTLWVAGGKVRPEGLRLAAILAASDVHNLDPARYAPADIAAALEAGQGGDRRALARAELLLSREYVRFLADIRTPSEAVTMIHADEALAERPAVSPRTALEAAAAAPSLAMHLEEAQRLNPVYDGLRRGLAGLRAADTRRQQVLRANLERARALPMGAERFVLVDTAGAQLWLFEGGEAKETMRVIVGKPDMATPEMTGTIQHAVLNPYWNMPPDLARIRARRVLVEGPGVIARERLQILSGWVTGARILSPAEVDWRSVAAGRRDLRMRQLPGPGNVMGSVKFMLPNELGIYLHDTANKGLFEREDRRLSSGCVRVADAGRLAQWLFGRSLTPKGGAPEQRMDLPRPVPVYIAYLTALPTAKGVRFQPDSYGRDEALIARLEGRAAPAEKPAPVAYAD